MSNRTDFSDAAFVLRETRARENAAARRTGEESPADPDFDACLGDGWGRPFMVRAEGRLAIGPARGFAASGAIVEGRGIGAESRFEVISDSRGQAVAEAGR